MLMHRPQTPQPGFGSITLLKKFTPHFKILDPRLLKCTITFAYHCSKWREKPWKPLKVTKQMITRRPITRRVEISLPLRG